MKTALMLAGLIIAAPAVADTQYLDRVETPVVTVEGASAHQLAERARLCIIQNVTNDSVVLKDNSRVNPMFSVATMSAGDTNAVQGGDVLQTVDLDAGLVVAHSRVQLTRMMMRHAVESTITFEAKDGRFRIAHSGIKAAMLSTGYASNNGFQPVIVQAGSGYQKIEDALQAVSAKIGECVVKTDNSNW